MLLIFLELRCVYDLKKRPQFLKEFLSRKTLKWFSMFNLSTEKSIQMLDYTEIC